MYALDDRLTGVLVMVGSLLGVALYYYLLFVSPWALLVLQVSAFMAVTAVLVIMAWIGYTLITTPPMEELKVDLEDFDTDEETGEYDSSSNEKAESSTEENLDTNEYQP